MELAELQKAVQDMYSYADKQGKAVRGQIMDGSCVLVDGRSYPYKVAVPVHCYAGKRVYVHITDGKAVVIGG